MPRIVLATVVIALGAVHPGVAQDRPDFSGTWELVTEDQSTQTTPALGRVFSIEQDDETLSVTQTWMRVRCLTGAGCTSSEVPKTTTVHLDGSGRPGFLAGPADAPRRTGSISGIRSYVEASVARARFVGSRLVIVDYNATRFTMPGLQPDDFTRREMMRLVLSLGATGALVVDRMSIGDLLPWGDAPGRIWEPVRSVYRRAAASSLEP